MLAVPILHILMSVPEDAGAAADEDGATEGDSGADATEEDAAELPPHPATKNMERAITNAIIFFMLPFLQQLHTFFLPVISHNGPLFIHYLAQTLVSI